MAQTNNIEKVLVIGGAGYLGSVLVGRLLDKGYKTTVFDSLLFGDFSLTNYRKHKNFMLINESIENISTVSSAIIEHDAVILLAAIVGEPACDKNPKETIDINYLASKNIIEACKYYKTKRFIFASTDSCYGIQIGIIDEEHSLEPISLYGRLKFAIENELRSKDDDLCWTILRMATIYGLSPRMRFDLIINLLAMHAAVERKIKIYGGRQWRPLVHVSDAADSYIRALEAPEERIRRETFNVGSNDQNYMIYQIGDLVADIFHREGVEIETIPAAPDLRDYHVNFDKIHTMLGFQERMKPRDGILEIKDAIESGGFRDVFDRRYRNA